MYEKVSDERFKAFLQLSTKYYSWDIILQNAGISEVADKGDQYEIRCILHEDKRPSLRLNTITGVYNGKPYVYTQNKDLMMLLKN